MKKIAVMLFCLTMLCGGCGSDNRAKPETAPAADAGKAPAADNKKPSSPSNAAAPSAPAPAPEKAINVDLTGFYFFSGDQAAKQFAELSDLSIDDTRAGKPDGKIAGWFDPANNKGSRFNIIDAKLTGDKLSFRTAEVDGISYQFEGKVLKDGTLSETQPDGNVLEGQLSKWKKGAKQGESKVAFTYSVGG
jgi:hypothetical protein